VQADAGRHVARRAGQRPSPFRRCTRRAAGLGRLL